MEPGRLYQLQGIGEGLMGCGCGGAKKTTQKPSANQARMARVKQETRTPESREIYRQKLAELSQPKKSA